jgi:SAM-dependent methyltransferase
MAGVPYYDVHAQQLTEQYESLEAHAVHHWLMDLLPTGVNSRALDVGAGSGRDAAWLVSRGFEVWAVEPSKVMRQEAQKRHAEAAITWLDDHLPALERTRMAASQQGVSFNFILMSAVWMHLAPQLRETAFKKLMGLLAAEGILAVTLRCGPAPAEREMYEVTEEEIRQLSTEYGATVLRCLSAPDQSGRSEISWIQMVLQKIL